MDLRSAAHSAVIQRLMLLTIPGSFEPAAAIEDRERRRRPTCGKLAPRRRQERPKSRRNPGKFHTAV